MTVGLAGEKGSLERCMADEDVLKAESSPITLSPGKSREWGCEVPIRTGHRHTLHIDHKDDNPL